MRDDNNSLQEVQNESLASSNLIIDNDIPWNNQGMAD
jgi:hypothetical protein